MQNENVVIIRCDENGEISFFATGSSVRVFIVDERTPNDRAFEWTRRDESEVRSILGNDPIGSPQDERHAAASARIIEVLDGTPRLQIVKTETPK